MQVGCFGGLVFSVDSNKVFTMQDIQGSTGSDWATHNTINGKPKSELTGQKLKAYKFTVTLTDASDAWDCVAAGGRLVRCKIDLSFEEYA